MEVSVIQEVGNRYLALLHYHFRRLHAKCLVVVYIKSHSRESFVCVRTKELALAIIIRCLNNSDQYFAVTAGEYACLSSTCVSASWWKLMLANFMRDHVAKRGKDRKFHRPCMRTIRDNIKQPWGTRRSTVTKTFGYQTLIEDNN